MALNLTNVCPSPSSAILEQEIQRNSLLYLSQLIPGQHQGRCYYMLNPNRADQSIGSFYMELNKWFWIDHATGDKGKGYISLVAFLKGMDYARAKQWVLRQLGGVVGFHYSPPKVFNLLNRQVQIPVPLSARTPQKHPQWGHPTHVWEYLDEQGRLIMYRCRYDGGGKKWFKPFTYWSHKVGSATVSMWSCEDLPGTRYLYGLDRLAACPQDPVMVCEGEKSADAAQLLLPDFVCMTSPNGAKAADRADWSPLQGRVVFIWPDNDATGFEYAQSVQLSAYRAGASSVTIIDFNSINLPKGWDAADALRDGWTRNDLTGII